MAFLELILTIIPPSEGKVSYIFLEHFSGHVVELFDVGRELVHLARLQIHQLLRSLMDVPIP